MNLENLFSPIMVGRSEVKNRIVMAPMGANFEAVDGSVTEALIDYFEERARGEVGLIISPFAMVSSEQRIGTLGIFSDRFIPGMSRLCGRVQSFGAKFVLQIAHPGGKAMRELTGKRPLAPSSIESLIYSERPRELTREEIEELIEEFVEAARRAKEAGCDGIEVHGAHTYLVGQFISPHTNRREDEYGKDLEGRMKFPSSIVKGVRRICGEDFVVGFKFSAHEHLEEGVDDDLARKIARYIEKEGADYIHAAATSSTIPGFLECDFPSVPSIYSPQGVLVKLAENVKKDVGIPVIGTGGITDPEYAERVLREGRADLVAIGRALIADAQWALNARTGKKPRYCIKCNTCHKELFARRRVKCAVNPAAGEERRFEMRKSLSPKKVAVVGAGPAGMEAALVASQRGHNVILYEEKDSIGGKMVFASVPQFKPEIGKLLEYYERILKSSPVEVRLGHRISALDDLSRESPEVVIVAVGADLLVPEIPGIEKEKVLTVLQLFEDKTLKIGKEVVVVGAGLIGSETSWYLASQNKSVAVVDTLARESILEDEHPTNRSMLIRSMEKEGVKILEKREIVRIEEEGAVVKRENGTEELLLADNVVFATGFEPKGDLRGALSKVSFDAEVYFIGDCVEPRKLCEAIHEGYHAAWKI